MTTPLTHEQRGEALSEEAIAADSKVLFGFWVYLMTDFVLFAALFATFAVLRSGTFGGPSGRELFSMPLALTETFLLLSSSAMIGFALLSARAANVRGVLVALAGTWILGAAFLVLELSEGVHLIEGGNGPSRSGFLSSYFALVGTHGLHVAAGLLFMLALSAVIYMRGLTRSNMRKLLLLAFFWHFLEVVWIFIFTFVYLFSV